MSIDMRVKDVHIVQGENSRSSRLRLLHERYSAVHKRQPAPKPKNYFSLKGEIVFQGSIDETTRYYLTHNGSIKVCR